VGRLPVRSIFERLTEDDLYEILRNPNNPIILGKKLDFDAYGIQIKFEDDALRLLALNAFSENTGARGLVSAVERALMPFEKTLPSTHVKKFAVTADVIQFPEISLEKIVLASNQEALDRKFEAITANEQEDIKAYIKANRKNLSQKYNLTLNQGRIDLIARYYTENIIDIGNAIEKIKGYGDEIKKIELFFFKNHDINIVLEDDAIDFLIDKMIELNSNIEDFYQQLAKNLEHGLKLVRERTGKKRFFITRDALINPEAFVRNMIANTSPTNE
jgi:hypothetical protein